MKIYLYDPETGVYLGEDFADESPSRRGEFVLPPDATTIAPPQVKPGETPVFGSRAQQWEIRAVSNLRRNRLRGTINTNTPSEESQ